MIDYETVKGPNGEIAYEWVDGTTDLPPIVFLHGLKSDMEGSKAEYLRQYCLETGRDFLRFDVFAHGKSDGDFMDFTMGKAVEDTIFMLTEA
ncbi:MAG: alpha/beta hydrolase, partial [Alphaproteobacteria bacterium]